MWIGEFAVSGYTATNATLANGGSHVAQEENYGKFLEVSMTVNMNAGEYYPTRIQYGQNTGSYECHFQFSEPGGDRKNDGTGYYYN